MAERIIAIKQAAHNVQEDYSCANVSSPSLEEDMLDIGVAIFSCHTPSADLVCEN